MKMQNIYDVHVEEPIPCDYGFGVEFTTKYGSKCISDTKATQYYKTKYPLRCVELDISSFIGSIGAQHYYGKFTAPDVSFTWITVEGSDAPYNKPGDHSCILGAFKKPESMEGISIDVTRPATKRDIDKDKDRWYGFEVGEPTNGFFSEQEVIDEAIRKFHKIFGKGWQLVIKRSRKAKDGYWEDYYDVLAKNE